MYGKVKYWSTVKGIGFIVPQGEVSSRETDVFVHYTALEEGHGNLQVDDRVEFECIQTKKGRQAKNVKRIL